MTNYEKIKNMSVEEMAEFLTRAVDDENQHEIGCYDCCDYGTHHSNPQNKEFYTCGGCPCEGVGYDLVKWLNKEVSE